MNDAIDSLVKYKKKKEIYTIQLDDSYLESQQQLGKKGDD